MKARKTDEHGRIVLPIEYREALGLRCGDEVTVRLIQGGILIQPLLPTCRLCGASNVSHKRLGICDDCIQIVKCYAEKD